MDLSRDFMIHVDIIETKKRHNLSKTAILDDLSSQPLDSDSDGTHERGGDASISEITLKIRASRKMSPDSLSRMLPKSCISDIDDVKTVTTHRVLSTIQKETQSSIFEAEDLEAISQAYAKNALNAAIDTLKPRDYQEAIVEHICSQQDAYGRIISLETGLGKTFIALLFICKKLNINYEKAPKWIEGNPKGKKSLPLNKKVSRLR